MRSSQVERRRERRRRANLHHQKQRSIIMKLLDQKTEIIKQQQRRRKKKKQQQQGRLDIAEEDAGSEDDKLGRQETKLETMGSQKKKVGRNSSAVSSSDNVGKKQRKCETQEEEAGVEEDGDPPPKISAEEAERLRNKISRLRESRRALKRRWQGKLAEQERLWQEKVSAQEALHVKEKEALLSELQEKTLCMICLDRPRDTFILPCLHYLYCFTCLSRHTQYYNSSSCPSCRRFIHGLCKVSTSPGCSSSSAQPPGGLISPPPPTPLIRDPIPYNSASSSFPSYDSSLPSNSSSS